jgi:hypothetical protein
MPTYTVQFEFRKPGAPEFKQWHGGFKCVDPKHARNVVVGQLQMLGYEVGTVAVYDGEWLVLGSVLPRPFTPLPPPTLH